MVPKLGQLLKPMGGENNCSTGGCGYTGTAENGTKNPQTGISGKIDTDSGDLSGLLDVAVQRTSRGQRAKTRSYNPDPKIADYESAEEIMEIFLNA